MIQENDFIVNDNFLAKEEFITFSNSIIELNFPWNFSSTMTPYDPESTPGFFVHIVYDSNVPTSPVYDSLFTILNQLNVAVILRIRLNLNHRLPEPYYSPFHSDTEDMSKDIATRWTTSILYINTNNGYTEFEDGTKVESVANRLVTFPSNIRHRIVTQTDEQTRILINFNYLKEEIL